MNRTALHALAIRCAALAGLLATLLAPATPAEAAVGFRAAASARAASGSGTTTLTVNKPTGTSSGDVMVASVTAINNTVTVTAPSGWTQIRKVTQSTAGSSTSRSVLYTFWKAAGSSEPSSYGFSLTAHSGAVAGIVSLTGADTSAPVDAESGVATASSRNHTAPSITALQSGDMLVTSHEFASTRTWTPPSGMTEAVENYSLTPNNSSGISLEMNYLALAATGATGTKTATASGNGDYGATQSVLIKPTASLTCYTDSFTGSNGASPGSNWSVGNESGSFGNPVIWNNSLRLTSASSSVATWATLQRLFPAAGNKIVISFQHYAYGGSGGADGIGVILSDAAYAPKAGAFGGSLGYAPKQTALGGDVTHAGFAGGWLGVGIDEYGNFSADTEGRNSTSVGLPAAPGTRTDSVAIRGSWASSDATGYTGYGYLTGTAAGQTIDNVGSGSQSPGYYYRITVDHSDGVHAYTTVERDTGGGYTPMIATFDAKAMAGQSAVPTSWYLSFTGSTGGSTNIHEIDNLQVCSTTMQTASFHHLEIDHDGSGVPGVAETVTIKACADSACSSLYLGSVTATPTTSGVTWSPTSATLSGGQASFTLTKSSAGSITLAATNNLNSNTTRCFVGTTENCVMVFSSFDAVEVGGNPATPLYTKIAGTLFSVDVLALNAGGTVNSSDNNTYRVDLVNPGAASGNCSDNNTGLTSSQNVTLSSGRKSASFTYTSAAAQVKVRIRNSTGSQVGCSSDDFAIRPARFDISSTTSGLVYSTSPGSSFVAGSDFNLTATPNTSAANTISSGYSGTPALVYSKIVDHLAVAVASPPLNGSFGAAAGGASSATFQYHDAGSLSFTTDAVTDTGFTAVDSAKATPDCVVGSTEYQTPASGKFGCSIGSAGTVNLGRFKPDHFDIDAVIAAGQNPATSTQFTYMNQTALTLTLNASAMSSDGTTVLSRYEGSNGDVSSSKLKLATVAVTADNGGSAVSLSGRLSLPTLNWVDGKCSVDGTYSFARAGSGPDGPYDSFALKMTVTDSTDGVLVANVNDVAYNSSDSRNTTTTAWTVAGDPAGSPLLTTTRLRFGRLRLLNVYGSELLDPRMEMRTEYWTGSRWTTNTLDSTTTPGSSMVATSNFQGSIASATVQSVSAMSSGLGAIVFAKPGLTGSFDVALNLGSSGSDSSCNSSHGGTAGSLTWLRAAWGSCGGASTYAQDPNARVRVGASRAPYIYLRERY